MGKSYNTLGKLYYVIEGCIECPLVKEVPGLPDRKDLKVNEAHVCTALSVEIEPYLTSFTPVPYPKKCPLINKSLTVNLRKFRS